MIYKMYRSLDDITVRVFFAISTKREYSLMFKNQSAFFKWLRKHFFKDRSAAYDLYHDIYDDYCDKTDSQNARNYFMLVEEINNLQVRYITTKNLISALNEINKEVIGRELLGWGFIFNPKGRVVSQIKQLKQQLRASSNKIVRKQAELREMTEEQEKQKTTIIKNAFQLENITGIKVDLDKNTMTEYLELIEFSRDIVEQKKEALKQNRQNGE